MVNERGIHRDLDMTFSINPITGDVSRKIDLGAIKQSVKNLVLSSSGDHKFHPEIYCISNTFLFEQMDAIDIQLLSRDIEKVLELYEPRIHVNNIEVRNDEDSTIRVRIHYTVKNTDIRDYTEFSVVRTR